VGLFGFWMSGSFWVGRTGIERAPAHAERMGVK
jgi:hypothetical protein